MLFGLQPQFEHYLEDASDDSPTLWSPLGRKGVAWSDLEFTVLPDTLTVASFVQQGVRPYDDAVAARAQLTSSILSARQPPDGTAELYDALLAISKEEHAKLAAPDTVQGDNEASGQSSHNCEDKSIDFSAACDWHTQLHSCSLQRAQICCFALLCSQTRESLAENCRWFIFWETQVQHFY